MLLSGLALSASEKSLDDVSNVAESPAFSVNNTLEKGAQNNAVEAGGDTEALKTEKYPVLKDSSSKNKSKQKPDGEQKTDKNYPDLLGFYAGRADGDPDLALYFLDQGGYWLLNTDNGPFNFQMSSKYSSSFDYDSLYASGKNPGFDLYGKLREEIRDTLGDTVYTKIIWTYREIGYLDSLIQSHFSQFALDGRRSYLRPGYSDLEDKLNFQIMFPGDNGRVQSNEMYQTRAFTPENRGLPTDQLNSDAGNLYLSNNNDFYFSHLYSYLNLINFLYLLLALLLVKIIGKVIRVVAGW